MALERHAAELVGPWCRALGVPVPSFRITNRRGAGRYRKLGQRISLGPADFEGPGKAMLVHELAHHVAHAKGMSDHHGPGFCLALVAVATVAYPSPRDYRWDTEYARVRAWARRHRLLSPAPVLIKATR